MSTLRGALVGFGSIAERGHVPAYASKASPLDIVAVAEPCAARYAAIRARLPEARIYPNFERLLAREALDFVDVCAPPSEHMKVSLAAFARGLHVLCERPLAMSLLEARRMVGAAIRAQSVLFPVHSYLHAPIIRAVRGLLSHDLIGPVRMVAIDTWRTDRARGRTPWHRDWRREPRYAGAGILAFEWLADYPSSVSAWTRSVRGDGVEGNATCTMVFPCGIARAHISRDAGIRRAIYALHGDRGSIRVEDDELEVVVRAADGGTRSWKSSLPSNRKDPAQGPWFEGVLRGFTRAVEQRDFVGKEATDAIMGIRVASAAVSSARRGGTPIVLPSNQDVWSRERCA
jgi:predicted dehydrogenase